MKKKRILTKTSIEKYSTQEERFIKEMLKYKASKSGKWDEYFDGDLDPGTMRPVEGCGTTRDKCYLIQKILRFRVSGFFRLVKLSYQE